MKIRPPLNGALAAALVTALTTVLASVLVSCGSGDDPDASPSTASSAETADAKPLPVGKEDIFLEPGSYLSPEGFEPGLLLEIVDSGWDTVHRGADGFDLGVPEPDRDAPSVAVVFLSPSEDTPDAALAAIRQNADATGGTVKEISGPVGPFDAEGVDITGGTGQLVASRDGGIALDVSPEGRVQVWVADAAGKPLVVVVLVPDANVAAATEPMVTRLLGGLKET